MAKYEDITFKDLIAILNNSGISLNQNRRQTIQNGKSEKENQSIDRAAHIAYTDAMAIEQFITTVQDLGWRTSYTKKGENGVAIKFTPEDGSGKAGKDSFSLDFSVDKNGQININGMPSVNMLIAGISDSGDLTLSTAQSAWFRKMTDIIQKEKVKQGLKAAKSEQERLSMLRWVSNQAKRNTLSSSPSYTQNKEIDELLNETAAIKGSNPYRRVRSQGDILASSLFDQIIRLDKNGFLNHFRNGKTPFYSQDAALRAEAKAANDLSIILSLYANVGPEQAEKIIKKDFNYIYRNNKVMPTIRKAFGQFTAMGIHQGPVSDTNAMRVYALNKPLIHGGDFFLENQRKTTQTLLTHGTLSKLKGTPRKQNIKGSIFSNALKQNLPKDLQDLSLGDFDLQGRAFVSPEEVRQGIEDFKKHTLQKWGLTNKSTRAQRKKLEKKFNEKYGEYIAKSVIEDALLYNEEIARDFDPFISKTESLSVAKLREHLKWEKGKTYSKTEIEKAISAVSARLNKTEGHKYKDLKYDEAGLLWALENGGERFDIAYREAVKTHTNKFVTPNATYREVGSGIPREMIPFIMRAAQYKASQIFDKKGNLRVNFLANSTTGQKVTPYTEGGVTKQINKVEAKSIGDYFLGFTNEVAYSYIDAEMDRLRESDPTKDDKALFEEAAKSFIQITTNKIEKINEGILKEALAASGKTQLSPSSNAARTIKANNQLIKKLKDGSIFSVNNGKIDWFDNDGSGKGFNVGKDIYSFMEAMGMIYGDLFEDVGNPISIQRQNFANKGISFSKQIILRHPEALHASAIYGSAIPGKAGYQLAQGYREKAAINRITQLAELGMKGGNIAGGGQEKTAAEWAKDYYNTIYEERTQLGSQEYARRYNAAKEVFDNAFALDMEDRIGNISNAIIIDMAEDRWKDAISELDYDEGMASKESFKKSFLGILEAQIVEKMGLKDISELKPENMPKLFLRTPNGVVASHKYGDQLGAASLLPLYYNPAREMKDGMEILPEHINIKGILSGFRDIWLQNVLGTGVSQELGDLYDDYLKALDYDFSKEGTTYERGNKASIAHAIMPSLMSIDTDFAGKMLKSGKLTEEDFRGSLIISEEDARNLLKPSREDLEAYKKIAGDNVDVIQKYTDDVLLPMYEDIFGKAYKETKQKQSSRDRYRRIRKKILDAATIGTQAFKDTKGRGLLGLTNRYPSSQGRDIKAAKIFIGQELAAGTMGGDQAMLRLMHADFDGDHSVMRLWFADGTVISKKYSGKEFAKVRHGIMQVGRTALEQQKFANDIYRELDNSVAAPKEKNKLEFSFDPNAASVMTADEIAKLTDKDEQAKLTFLSKYNKTLTGTSSNLFQSFERTMANAGTDDTSVAALLNGAAFSAGVTRAVLQSFVENAISAKKVEKKGDGSDTVSWWNTASEIFEELKDENVWKELNSEGGPDRLRKLFSRMQGMGILKDQDNGGGMFDNWIAGNILPLLAPALGTEEGRARIAKIYGLKPEDLAKYSGLDSKAIEQEILKDSASLFKIKDIETVIRALQDQNQLLKGEGNGGLWKAAAGIYETVPGVGYSFKRGANSTIVPGSATAEMLKKAGIIVRPNGDLDYSGYVETQTYRDQVQKIEFEHAIGEMDLADFAKPEYKKALREKQLADFSILMGNKAQMGENFRNYTSATSFARSLFPGGSVGLPLDEFNARLDELIKSGKTIEDAGVDKTLGFSQDVFNMTKANAKSVNVGHFVHSMADLYFTATMSNIKGIGEDVLESTIDTFIDKYKEDVKTKGKDFKLGKNASSSDKKIWSTLKDKIVEYVTEESNLSSFLGALSPESKNWEMENARLRAKAQFDYAKQLTGKNVIASEAQLYGSRRGSISNDRSDLIYNGIYKDFHGNESNAVYVLDYKNTKGGKITPEQIMQVAAYADDLKQLRESVLEATAETDPERNFSGKDYLNYIFNEDNLKDKNGNLNKLGRIVEGYKVNGKLPKQFENILTAILTRGENGFLPKIMGQLLETDQYGMQTLYAFDPGKLDISGHLAKAQAGGAFTQEEADKILSYAEIVDQQKIEGIYNQEDQVKKQQEYLRLVREIVAAEDQLFNIERRIQLAREAGNEAAAAELENKKSQLTTEEEIANKRERVKQLWEGEDRMAQPFKDMILGTYGDLESAEKAMELHHDVIREQDAERKYGDSYKKLKTLYSQKSKLEAAVYTNRSNYNFATGNVQRMALDDQLEATQAQLTSVQEQLDYVMNQIPEDMRQKYSKELGELQANYQADLARRQTNADVQVKGQNTLWGQLGQQFNFMVQRFIRMGAAHKILNTIRKDIQKLVQAATQLDKAITNLRIVTGDGEGEAKNLINTYAKLADTLGATTTEVATSATSWLRQGYAMNEVNELVTSSLYLSKLGMISAEEATRAMTSALKGFKLEATDAMSVVDKLTALDVKAATTAGDIATALQAFANIATMNGVDIDQASAMAATIMDVSQASSSTVGAALKTILSRYGNVKAGAYSSMNTGYDNDETTSNLNDVERVLNKIGVSVRDSNLQFREFDDVLMDLAEKWKVLDTVSKNAVASAFAGTRQRESFMTLMNNMDKYQDLLETSRMSGGTAEKKFQAYQESIEALQKRLQAAWEELANNANIRDFMKSIIKVTTYLVKHLPQIFRTLTRFIAVTQGYKIPRIAGAALNFIDPFGITNKQAIKAGGGLRGAIFRSINGKSYGSDIDKYYGAGAKGGMISKVTSALEMNTKAIEQNTSAVNGNSRTTKQQTASGGKINPVEDAYFNKSAEASADVFANASYRKDGTIRRGWSNFRNTMADKKPLIRQVGARAAGAAAAGLTAALTSSKTFDVNGVTYEKSAAAYGVGSALSGSLTAAGSLISPVLGMLGGTIGEMLGPVIAKAIDSNAVATAQRKVVNEKASTTLQTVSSNFDTLYKVAEKASTGILNADDYLEMEAAKKNILDTYNKEENKDLRDLLIQNFKEITNNQYDSINGLGDILKATEDNAQIYYELKLAQLKTENQAAQALRTSKESELYGQANQVSFRTQQVLGKMSDAGSIAAGISAGIGTAGAGAALGAVAGTVLPGIGNAIGAIIGAIIGGIAGTIGGVKVGEGVYNANLENLITSEFANQTLSERIQAYETLLEDNRQGQIELTDELKDTVQSAIDELKQIKSSVKALQKEADQSKVKEAMLGATMSDTGAMLGTLSTLQKKGYGVDELYRTIAAYLDENGGLEGGLIYSDRGKNEITAYAESVITSILKQDDEYAKILSGDIYTVKEIAQLQQTGTIGALSTANQAKYQAAVERWGDISALEEFELNQQQYEETEKNKARKIDVDNALQAYLKKYGVDNIDDLLSAVNDAKSVELGSARRGGIATEVVNKYAAESKAIADLIKEQSKLQTAIEKHSVTLAENVDELSETIEEDKKIFTMFNSENIRNQELIQTALRATGATSMEDFQKRIATQYGDMTLADFGLSHSENLDKIKTINSLMSEIASSSKSWSEKTKDIVAQFPTLITYLNDSTQLQNKLIDKMVQYAEIQVSQQFDSIIGNQEYYDQNIRSLLQETSFGDSSLFAELRSSKDFSNVTDIKSLMLWAEQHQGDEYADASKRVKELLAQELGATQLVSDEQKELIKTMITYQTTLLDKQISNLEDQKNALSEINAQRKYENELIEAKLKLENAQKEKKRIWREGVGWVYEADQTAVKAAQEEVDKLDNQKKISELEEQITQMKADKDMLANISKEEELALQKELYNSWIKKYQDQGSTINANFASLFAAYLDKDSPLVRVTSTVDAQLTNFYNSWEEAQKASKEALTETYGTLEAKKAIMEQAQSEYSSDSSITNRERLASATQAYNTALLDYQNAYETASKGGYIKASDYSGDQGAFSDAALRSATQEEQKIDMSEEWFLPRADGTTLAHATFLGKSEAVPLTEKELSQLQNDLNLTKYHDSEMWESGSNLNSPYVNNHNDGTAIPDNELLKHEGGITQWLNKHQNAIIWSKNLGGYIRIAGGKAYHMTTGGKSDMPREKAFSGFAQGKAANEIPRLFRGSLSTGGGVHLINEVGTEAIITPQGTLTSLPSKSGVIPADITNNLWQLGELAPSILRTLSGASANLKTSSIPMVNDESFNINNLTMNVNADDKFDIDAFVRSIKIHTTLSKNK